MDYTQLVSLYRYYNGQFQFVLHVCVRLDMRDCPIYLLIFYGASFSVASVMFADTNSHANLFHAYFHHIHENVFHTSFIPGALRTCPMIGILLSSSTACGSSPLQCHNHTTTQFS